MSCLWHHPTFRTSHADYGHVADRSNPSIRVQDRKAGPSDDICTINRIPIRHQFISHGVKWRDEFQNWDDIEQLCLDFSKRILQKSKVIIFVGQENNKDWRGIVSLGPDERLVKIGLRSESLHIPDTIYSAAPCFYAVRRNRDTITKLIFISYHSQRLMHAVDVRDGSYTDLVWNAALDFCGLEIREIDVFTRLASKKHRVARTWWACFFVEPGTGKRCYQVRRWKHTLKRHWEAHHAHVDRALAAPLWLPVVHYRRREPSSLGI